MFEVGIGGFGGCEGIGFMLEIGNENVLGYVFEFSKVGGCVGLMGCYGVVVVCWLVCCGG